SRSSGGGPRASAAPRRGQVVLAAWRSPGASFRGGRALRGCGALRLRRLIGRDRRHDLLEALLLAQKLVEGRRIAAQVRDLGLGALRRRGQEAHALEAG